MILKFEDFDRKRTASYEEVLGVSYDDYKISQALPDYLYVVFRALTANVANMNADQFDTEELERFDHQRNCQVFQTFNGRSIFTNHQADKVENSIGVIFDSHFDKTANNDQFVEIVFGIDRKKAEDIARGVETKRLRSGSMGCSITHSLCSVCGKEIRTEQDFCSHLKNYRGMDLNGTRVAERLRGVAFNEYSIVTVGADPKAKLRYLVSSIIDYKRLPKAAAESDIFDLMRIIATEVKNASPSEKVKIASNLRTILSDNSVHIEKSASEGLYDYDVDTDVNNQLSTLFNYAKLQYEREIEAKIHRPTLITPANLQDYIGSSVEVDSNGSIYVL